MIKAQRLPKSWCCCEHMQQETGRRLGEDTCFSKEQENLASMKARHDHDTTLVQRMQFRK